MEELIQSLTLVGKKELVNNIKVLLFKEDENIFDLIDFENDNIYQDPLFYAYFNSPNRAFIDLQTLIYGYIKEDLRPKRLKISSDSSGRFYISNIGWFITEHPSVIITLERDSRNDFNLFLGNKKIDFIFETIEFIDGTNIELLKYPISLLNQCYYDIHGRLITVEIEEITRLKKVHLTNAFKTIKELMPLQFEIIDQTVKKAVIFNVDTTLRNSFATMKALGTIFLNSYQDDYKEIFFIDDIVHQSGHCIFYNVLWDTKLFFKVDPATPLSTFLIDDVIETRDLNILFHALYTYHVTLLSLFKCLNENLFKRLDKHELIGRIHFYLRKFFNDILLIDKTVESNERAMNIFTKQGLEIYLEMKKSLLGLLDMERDTFKDYDFSNQPYNFTFSKFLELNPLNEITN